MGGKAAQPTGAQPRRQSEAGAEDWGRYLALNTSFADPFIFRLTRRGFFSEVNVLLDAIIFGLLTRRRLLVTAFKFNGLRWNDYFGSALPEAGQAVWDQVGPDSFISDKNDPFEALRRWTDQRRGKILDIPELGLRGDQMAVRRWLLRRLCRPSSEVAAETDALMAEHALVDGGFSAIHVRRGDKVQQRIKGSRAWSEGVDVPIARYVDLIRSLGPGTPDVFVLTDDHAAVDELADPRHGFRVVALCPSDSRGHDQPSFNLQTAEDRRAIIRRLVIETGIAARSGFFAGGYQSNVARYVATVHADPGRCVSVDAQKTPWENY